MITIESDKNPLVLRKTRGFLSDFGEESRRAPPSPENRERGHRIGAMTIAYFATTFFRCTKRGRLFSCFIWMSP